MRNRPLISLLAAVGLVLLAACSDGGAAPPVTGGSTAEESLPPPDPGTFVGTNQVVNLAVLPDGSTPTFDIWALRTFSAAPVLLVEGLPYGQVSPHFATPPNAAVAAIPAGKGPDAPEFSGMFTAGPDQQYTTVLVYDRESKAGSGLLLEDVDPTTTSAFPDANPGQALVQFYAYQLTLNPLAEGEGFNLTIGGKDVSYQVAVAGADGCAPQPRQTDQGYAPMVLGGTQRVPFDVAPGATTFTFHGWGTFDEQCADPDVIDPVTVSVTAGQRVWVLLHSRDGRTVESLVVPVA